jgi:hypothetical protein
MAANLTNFTSARRKCVSPVTNAGRGEWRDCPAGSRGAGTGADRVTRESQGKRTCRTALETRKIFALFARGSAGVT